MILNHSNHSVALSDFHSTAAADPVQGYTLLSPTQIDTLG